MKKSSLILLSLLAAVPLLAQDTNSSASTTKEKGGPAWAKHGKKHGPPPGANLTPDEQERLDQARDKAKDDPTVRSLREAKDALDEQLGRAMRAAMLAADPSLASTLDKVEAARGRAKEMRGKFESLTAEQKGRLKAARSAAQEDAAVKAAREKMRSAEGREAKREAAQAMHQAMKTAMLKADPGLESLLDQLGPPPEPRGPRGAGGPPDMDGPPDDPGSE